MKGRKEIGSEGFQDLLILTLYLELVRIFPSSFDHLMTGVGFPVALHFS